MIFTTTFAAVSRPSSLSRASVGGKGSGQARGQQFFAGAGHGFYPSLADQGFGAGKSVFAIEQPHRTPRARIGGAPARVMLSQAGFHNLGHARVEAVVAAAQDVDRPGPLIRRVWPYATDHLEVFARHGHAEILARPWDADQK